MFKKDNIPNFLTCVRIFLIPCIIVFLMSEKTDHHWIALILYFFACISDFLDGYMARKFQLESNFGKFFAILTHEMSHVFGKDGEREFSDVLTHLIEQAVSKNSVISKYSRGWVKHKA